MYFKRLVSEAQEIACYTNVYRAMMAATLEWEPSTPFSRVTFQVCLFLHKLVKVGGGGGAGGRVEQQGRSTENRCLKAILSDRHL